MASKLPSGPTSARSLLAGAKEFSYPLPILERNRDGIPLRACMVLAAHAVELCLKAYLLAIGLDDNHIRKLGHDLEAAWLAAVASGLALDSTFPYWCQLLNSAHAYPYVGRYPPVNAGLVSVGIGEMYDHIEGMIALVEGTSAFQRTAP